jgi:hypothetical protein
VYLRLLKSPVDVALCFELKVNNSGLLWLSESKTTINIGRHDCFDRIPSVGDKVYLLPTGEWKPTKPTAPYFALKVDANQTLLEYRNS